MAMTAWSANDLQERDFVCAVNGLTSDRATLSVPIAVALAHKRDHHQTARELRRAVKPLETGALLLRDDRILLVHNLLEVVDDDRALLQDGPAAHRTRPNGKTLPNHDRPEDSPQVRDPLVLIAEDARDPDVVGRAERACTLNDGVQDVAEIGRRGRDHTQHLGGDRLLLQRLAQLAVALLQFLEQAGVLDGDDGLVRERLQQRDLLRR